ncbi:MAG: CoA transferase [Actinomycetota bacterium]|nr:CoA transferase [Actinomycetota bacterium]
MSQKTSPTPGPRPVTPAHRNLEVPADAPLTGITVIDLSRVLAGPFVSMLLGDLGANVIKVERPGTGDDTRQWGPPFAGPPGKEQSTYFLSTNRNKRSIVLDFRDPEDFQTLQSLLRHADVVIENFRPGVMDRLGLSSDFLQELNPDLVCLSISGFGSIGPDKDRVGYDQILQAEGGMMGFTGIGTPTKAGVPVADLTAGLFGLVGVLAALIERNRSGRGQHVHTSLLGAMIGLHAFQGTRWLIGEEVPGPAGNQHPTVCPYGLFWTQDAPIVIAVGNDDIWRRFAPLVGISTDDERFVSNAARLAHAATLEDLINTTLKEKPVAHWMSALQASGVPAGEVKTLDRVYDDPHVHAEGLVMDVDHPTLGRIRLPGNPIRFSRSRPVTPLPPPLLGEHTDELKDRQ